MAAQPHAGMSIADYLAFEHASAEKHEYRDGEIVAMAGANYTHNTIVGNTAPGFHAQLHGSAYRVLFGSLRLHTPTNLYTYADLLVVGEQRCFLDEQRDTLLNPLALIEVVAPSTAAYDRGEKFRHYRSIESLREYVLIEQDSQRTEHFVRQANDRWLLVDTVGPDATLRLPTLDCAIPFAEIYEEVVFAATDDSDD